MRDLNSFCASDARVRRVLKSEMHVLREFTVELTAVVCSIRPSIQNSIHLRIGLELQDASGGIRGPEIIRALTIGAEVL